MNPGLERVVRVRSLLEEIAQTRLEEEIAEMQSFENAAEHAKEISLATRTAALSLLADRSPAIADWFINLSDADILGWKEDRLKALSRAAASDVDLAREELLSRRRDRRQAEILVLNSRREREIKRQRYEQKQVDDWFQRRSARRDRTR